MPFDVYASSCDPIEAGVHCDCWELGEPCCLCGEEDDISVCVPEPDYDDFDFDEDDEEDEDDYEDDDFEDDDEDE